MACMARSKKKTATTPEAQPPAASEPPKRGKRGPRPFEPTPEMRSLVETALGMGLTHEEASSLVINPATGRPIDPTTLRARFGAEIAKAEAVCHLEAAVSLRHLIRGRPARYDAQGNLVQAEVPINPAAVFFYHKTRRGWRETDRLELTGANGGSIKTEDVTKRARATLDSRISSVAARIAAKEETKTTH